MKRKALGKGLSSLIPQRPPAVPPLPPPSEAAHAHREAAPISPPPGLPRPGVQEAQIDIDRIRPNPQQPRQHFDEVALEELALSMRTQGILQPIVVRPAGDGRFEIVAGERRWRAAQRAGMLRVPAVVREIPDDRLVEMALIENIQREELNPIEEAQAYKALMAQLELTQQDVADRVGKQRSTVTNALRLLSLPQPVQELVRDGKLTAGHARAIAALASPQRQKELAEKAHLGGMSVRQVEAWVARASQPAPSPGGASAERDPNVVAAEQKLQSVIGTKVRIVEGPKEAGRLELHYYSVDELNRLYEMLMNSAKKRN